MNKNKVSYTPRTDLDVHWIEAHGLRLNHQYVSAALSRELERELNEAKETIELLEKGAE